jgi:O-antigen ligase
VARLLWTLLALSPLIYTTAYPNFDIVRLPWTSAVVMGLLILWLWAARRGDPMASPSPRLALAVGVFFAIQIFSSLRALNPGEGMEQISRDLSAAAVFFLVAAGPFSKELLCRSFPLWVSIAAGIAGLIGILQRFGIGLPWLDPQELLISTFGNPNYAGPYMAMAMALTLGAVLSESRWRVRLAIGASGVIQLIFCAISGSRAAWVGALLGLTVCAILILLKERLSKRHVLAIGIAAVPLFIGAGLFLGARASSEEWERLTRASYWTNRVRVEMWKETARAIPESPIWGQGGTNFKHWYGRNRSDEEVRLHSRNLSPRMIPDMDNCHNGHLQTLVESGLLGFGAWVLVLVLLIRNRARELDPIRIGALGAMTAFLVCNVFNTLPMQSAHWTLFWVCAGLLVWSEAQKRSMLPRWVWAAVTLGCLAQAVMLGVQVQSVFGYDAYRRSFDKGADVVRLLERSVDLNPHSVILRHELGLAYLRLRQKDGAREQFEAILKTNPEAPTAQLGMVFCESNQPAAEARLRKITEKLPTWPWPWERLGALELMRKNFPAALSYFDRAVELRSDFGDAHARRGIALAQLGRIHLAVEAFRKAAEAKYPCRVRDLPPEETREIRAIPDLAMFFNP